MLLRLRRWLRAALFALACAYPIALFGVWLMLAFIGERWWMAGVALYLPLVGFAIPLPPLVLALALARRWKLLILQVASLLLLLFPIMGLTLSWPRSAPASGRTLRVLSYNVNSGHGGFPALKREIISHRPDLVFVQELPNWSSKDLEAELREFPHIAHTNDFFVASKFPIVEQVYPERLPFYEARRSPRFMKVVVDTSLGKISVYHVHPLSPRGGFYELRGKAGFRREILSGRLFSGDNAEGIRTHNELRELQVATFAAQAAREPGPALIVGDTNTPHLSRVRRKYLSQFQDGFAQAGFGFGYTYPGKHPWMRIDVVMASSHFRFIDFDVGRGQASDHRCVVAELALANDD
jgi:vancomycin resistance protein VanJ